MAADEIAMIMNDSLEDRKEHIRKILDKMKAGKISYELAIHQIGLYISNENTDSFHSGRSDGYRDGLAEALKRMHQLTNGYGVSLESTRPSMNASIEILELTPGISQAFADNYVYTIGEIYRLGLDSNHYGNLSTRLGEMRRVGPESVSSIRAKLIELGYPDIDCPFAS